MPKYKTSNWKIKVINSLLLVYNLANSLSKITTNRYAIKYIIKNRKKAINILKPL